MFSANILIWFVLSTCLGAIIVIIFLNFCLSNKWVFKQNSKLLWFHAASIGEFRSIIPIIKQLNIQNKNFKYLITTTTVSSGNLAKQEFNNVDNIFHRYLPLDVPFLIEKFLCSWKPNRIFLIDSEIWPNFILKAKSHNIPIALINARLTAKSYNRWMRFPSIAKEIFGIFKLCICSNLETKKFLERLKVQNNFFLGNLKFIGNIDEKKIKSINENIFLTKKFWFAASTHKRRGNFLFEDPFIAQAKV